MGVGGRAISRGPTVQRTETSHSKVRGVYGIISKQTVSYEHVIFVPDASYWVQLNAAEIDRALRWTSNPNTGNATS